MSAVPNGRKSEPSAWLAAHAAGRRWPESWMREIRTSSSMRGRRKRATAQRACALLYRSPWLVRCIEWPWLTPFPSSQYRSMHALPHASISSTVKTPPIIEVTSILSCCGKSSTHVPERLKSRTRVPTTTGFPLRSFVRSIVLNPEYNDSTPAAPELRAAVSDKRS